MPEFGTDYLTKLYEDARRCVDGLEAVTEVSITIGGRAPRRPALTLSPDENNALFLLNVALSGTAPGETATLTVFRKYVQLVADALSRVSAEV